jgi:metal-dependent amidase/aminoacylase/carboxypeptidase family protein
VLSHPGQGLSFQQQLGSQQRSPEKATTVNDERMYARAKEVIEGMLGKANVKIAPQTMGGEDFAFYAQRAAGDFFLIGVGNETCARCTRRTSSWMRTLFLLERRSMLLWQLSI